MKNIATVITLLFITLSISVPAAAWLDKVEEKANRGATNFAGFWLEIPYQLVEGLKKSPWTGIPVGLGMGIVMIPARMGAGVLELATFPAPLPGVGYGPLFEPAINPWIEHEEAEEEPEEIAEELRERMRR